MSERILHVKVGEPLEATLARAAHAMETLERGEPPAPYFGVGFSDVAQLFAVFTPRRWDLLVALRESGPMSIAELARCVKRDYKNVHGDVEKLVQWQALEKDEKTAASKRAPLPRAADYAKPFLQDWERLSRSGRYDMNRLKDAMLLLIANDGPLGPEWLDHPLGGDW